ncbi:MAG: helicase [Armatimonadetes bacterium]|nr:helicase [Armatimonadota bacterium]
MNYQEYNDFLKSKAIFAESSGFEVAPDAINDQLFPFQKAIVAEALRKGRYAIWADCGLGKTPIQLEWAKHVCRETSGDLLIVAPLAVSSQTAREGTKFGIPVTICRSQADVRPGINITNYEMLQHFDLSHFAGVVLDESSILKNYSGATRNQIIDGFARTPYKLACTATPSPNDHMELGNHAEFLGAMNRTEMLAMFFVHDGGETSQWRLKGHAEEEFWKWVCSWAVMIRKPSDLGYSDEGFDLPPLTMHEHSIESHIVDEGRLFAVEAQTLTERRNARRNSLEGRVEAAAAVASLSDEPFLLWCDLNDEGDALEKLIPGAVQVAGRHSNEFKEKAMLDFAEGRIRVLVSKPGICGAGMNFQICPNVGFVGLSDSYEAWYQAIRRCWRFGQKNEVQCHMFTSQAEGAVVANIKRKEADAEKMAAAMVGHLKAAGYQTAGKTERSGSNYQRETVSGEKWTAHLGDCVEVMQEMESQSIDYSIFSPPFAALFTYSNSDRDMGNARNPTEFYNHFQFAVKELFRITKEGRLTSFHCMNIPAMKERDGFIGIHDFRGDLIRIFQDCGFVYHSEVCIWKDPVTQMQRTKALGLLHKTIRKDSSMSRQGLADYLVTMRRPGVNAEPIAHTHETFPVDLWQRYASPVWMDINPSDTLQKESARDSRDERHICPLQLEVIRRALQLWSNPDDLIFSPFGGIGSESYIALEMGRRAVTSELKPSYFKQIVANLRNAEVSASQRTLFDELVTA